ncbi:cell division protein FtsQ/DivIB [Azospirillum sp. sgz302134]
MSARLSVDPQFRPAMGMMGSGMAGGRLRDDMPVPPRAMAQSAQKGNRRRAWPRWTRPAVKAAVLLTPVLVMAGLAGSAWKRGTFAETAAAFEESLIAVSGKAGFAVGEIMVVGRTETERDAILNTLGARRGDPILAVNLAEAKERLESLPWVSAASVERRLPNALLVRLSERQPMAIWQHDRKFTVIDREGRPLADAAELARRGNQRIDTLPQVVGANAPMQVPKLLAALDNVPSLRDKVSAATWLGDRRWDLKLKNGLVVKLPEAGMNTALRQLAALDASGKVLERDVVAIDLRQPDRAVLQTSATAVLPWTEEENKKKPGKKT